MKNKELQLVKFESEGKVYPLNIHDADGNRWISSKEVGEALGAANPRKLVSRLVQTGELMEGKHFRSLKLQNSGPGNPNTLVLSYRGIIRVAMRSEGKRAREFRDWAEDVLYEVMMTGCYLSGDAGGMPLTRIEDRARAEGIRRGLGLTVIQERYGLSTEEVVDFCWYRHLGMTYKQMGLLMGCGPDKLQSVSRMLDEMGVQLPDTAPTNKINAAKRRLFYRLLGIGSVEDDFLPIFQEVVNA